MPIIILLNVLLSFPCHGALHTVAERDTATAAQAAVGRSRATIRLWLAAAANHHQAVPCHIYCYLEYEWLTGLIVNDNSVQSPSSLLL